MQRAKLRLDHPTRRGPAAGTGARMLVHDLPGFARLWAARRQRACCVGRPTIVTAVRTVTLSRSWRVEPQASLPLPNASDTPMSAAAGMVVTEMNTPIKVLDRASVIDNTPTTPARSATMKENQLGASMRLETGRIPSAWPAAPGRPIGLPATERARWRPQG